MELRHALGQSLELRVPGLESPLWRYTYGGKPKPFFHPLQTPAGYCLSLFEPHDHTWHRGLWFTIKYINGENFWEEDDPYGKQVAGPATVTHSDSGSIAWRQDLTWRRPNNAGVVFEENRSITYIPWNEQAYVLDWQIDLAAQADLILDRTPFTTWGGYSGLIIRGNRNWQKTVLVFSDGTTSERPTGYPALWTDLSGTFDGGIEKTGGIALFDHPSNVRHPQPWYGATDAALYRGAAAGHYISSAFLFHQPMSVAKGEVLSLRYRTLIHDGLWDQSQLQAVYDSFAAAGRPGAR